VGVDPIGMCAQFGNTILASAACKLRVKRNAHRGDAELRRGGGAEMLPGCLGDCTVLVEIRVRGCGARE
jgi:hypothetical protein